MTLMADFTSALESMEQGNRFIQRGISAVFIGGS